MFKFTIYQFKKNWYISLGTYCTLFIGALFIGTFLNLLIASFINSAKPNTTNTTLFFIIYFGLVTLISLLIIKTILKLNFNLKLEQYMNLRILGFRISKIRWIVFLENIIFLLPILILAFGLSFPCANYFIKILIQKEIVDSNFVLYQNPGLIVGYVIIGTIMVNTLLYLATLKVKTISITKINNKNKDNKKIWWVKIILGCLFLSSAFGIYYSNARLDGATFLFGGLFMIIGFSLVGKDIIRLILLGLTQISKKSVYFQNAIKEFYNALNKLFQIILVTIIIIFFLIYSLYGLRIGSTPTVVNEPSNNHEQLIVFKHALEFLGTVLLYVMGVYAVVIAINYLWIFIISNRTEYQLLRKLGYQKSKIYWHIFYQTILLSFFGVIFSYLPTLFIGLMFDEQHLLQEPLIWILTPIILFSVIIIISFSILYYQFQFKNYFKNRAFKTKFNLK
ncbi:FtsX-like permease family protein [Spiroplasma sp. SV19]|uniref:FtsX-like permease family protein n=1 Tax=Spiroplasma sp. SV19 TaxID=2570468 RepID=UPI0024B6E1F6|nr:FtsX-like permease family protein [Spiroplasma sp. SV19]WHQ36661.1 FtsX-like permease family protein [Spiroplasma sp. SV19]